MEQQLTFNVQNGEVEGPLDLILQLITKNKLDIIDINISQLLEQYMEQIQMWQSQNLEVASEFLEMASRLVYIKTVSLLPRHKDEEDQAKAELVGQLLEYQACKRAAELLAMQNEGFGCFVHPPEPIPHDNTYRTRHPIETLLGYYRDAIGRGKRKLPPPPDKFTPIVAKPVVSVSSRIVYLLRTLYHRNGATLEEVYGGSKSRSELVAIFLAMLELIKSGRISTDARGVSLNRTKVATMEDITSFANELSDYDAQEIME